MLIKMGIIILMLCILGSLLSGLIFLVRDEGKTKRTLNALTIRIACSVGLFFLLLLAYQMHWISPHDL